MLKLCPSRPQTVTKHPPTCHQSVALKFFGAAA
jgi:hypothetical protein